MTTLLYQVPKTLILPFLGRAYLNDVVNLQRTVSKPCKMFL